MAVIVAPRLPLEGGSHQVWKSNPALWWCDCPLVVCQEPGPEGVSLQQLGSELTVQYLNVNSALLSHEAFFFSLWNNTLNVASHQGSH